MTVPIGNLNMSSNREKAEKLAQITLDEIERSLVCFRDTEYFFDDRDFNKLQDLESEIRTERAMALSRPDLSDNDIKVWEKYIIDYCNERDRLLEDLGRHYFHLINDAKKELADNESNIKRLNRDFELYKLVIANPTARDKKLLSKLSDINDLSDYSNVGATAALKGVKAANRLIYDKAKGDLKGKFLLSQGDIIDKGLENFVKYNQALNIFNAMKRNITVLSKDDYLKKGWVEINERRAIQKRIVLYEKRKQPAEWLIYGSNTESFNAYPFPL